MADLRDFTGKNRKFTGTGGERISPGTTAERVDTQGTIRFNTTTNLMEYYSGTDWKAIDAPPVITSFSIDSPSQTNVTSGYIGSAQAGTFDLSVNGSLFDTTGANVTLVGSGETLSANTTVRNSANLLTCTFTASNLDITNDPYTIKVTNGSGLSAELVDAITVDQAPVFTNAADTIFTVFDSGRSSGTIAAADLAGATDADGDTITYSVSSGSLPTGFTLNTSTGAITWSSVSAVGTDTTTTFSISAATPSATSTRQFKITVAAPVVTTYTSTGAFNFTVPSGLSAVNVLVVAGGGYGGGGTGGGGGAGGMIDASDFPVTPGGTVPGTVGPGTSGGNEISPGNGGNSTFGALTAIGGGSGGWDNSPTGRAPQPGGSGGGGNGHNPRGQGTGTGTQPSQPGVSGSSGYGNPGQNRTDNGGGGGGGAGGASSGGNGGAGRASSVSGSPVTYAGGGGGGGPAGSHTGGSGGGGNGAPIYSGSAGQPGTNNRGGGGGGSWDHGTPAGGGGTGIVVVSY